MKSAEVIIVGAGASGIGAAIALRHADVVVLEKAAEVGGTWRDNTYPGCACDVPSALYSYSFAPNPDWTRAFAGQAEILDYLRRIAVEHGVVERTRFGVEVHRAQWDETAQRWRLDTSDGEYEARVLVGATGPWHEPLIPRGLGAFDGPSFHSSRWDHDIDLTGKRVAVIGTGASAVQFVPRIAPKVAELHLFQRTAQWVLPKPDHFVPPAERWLFRNVPAVRRGVRKLEYAGMEALGIGFRHPRLLRTLQRVARAHLRLAVRDPQLRRVLTPDYTLGCKRLLMSNDYYPALTRPNVTVHGTAVREISGTSVIGANGNKAEVDVLIYGTGFRILDMPIAERVYDAGGTSLAGHWKGSPQAYAGTVVSGFPNLFLLLGPNLGTGHTSAFMILEAQLSYAAKAITHLLRNNWSSIDVRPEAQAAYNAEIQAALPGTVYNSGGCSSYYLDANGRNSFSWPWSTARLRRRLGAFDIEAFERHGATVHGGDLDPGTAEYHLDVADRASYESFVTAILERSGRIDVLVNNAGVMPLGAFLDEPDEISRVTLDVNVWGLIHGMRLVLPHMLERGQGHVVNIASMAGKIAFPGMAVYNASKYAAVGLTAAVREELAGTGVTVSAVLPSAVRTGLSSGVPFGRGLPVVEPEAVAGAVLRSVRTRRAEIPVPAYLSVWQRAEAVMPTGLRRLVMRLANNRRALDAVDRAARAAYESRIAGQAANRH